MIDLLVFVAAFTAMLTAPVIVVFVALAWLMRVTAQIDRKEQD